MLNLIIVFIGGGIGSIARYIVTNITKSILPITFPFGTLTVNIFGSFLMGVVMTLIATRLTSSSEQVRLFFAVGLLGGFTTFSSFSMETLTLIEKHEIIYAITSVATNVILGLFAAYLGTKII